jgi:hypothetical protein
VASKISAFVREPIRLSPDKLQAKEIRRPTPTTAERRLLDRAWEIHQGASENRKIIAGGDADRRKDWHRANPREPWRPTLSTRIGQILQQLTHYRGARPTRCGRTSDCTAPRLLRRCGSPARKRCFIRKRCCYTARMFFRRDTGEKTVPRVRRSHPARLFAPIQRKGVCGELIAPEGSLESARE